MRCVSTSPDTPLCSSKAYSSPLSNHDILIFQTITHSFHHLLSRFTINLIAVFAAVIALDNPGTESWVEAYIVGSAEGPTIDRSALTPPFQSASNILLADTPDETDLTKCVPVQLIANTPARINLNLRNHPDLLGRRVRVLGTLARYFNRPGVKSTTSFGL